MSVEVLLAIAVGIGLSAACGFRVFVPLLLLNLASRVGYVQLAPGFEWLGGETASVLFATATVLEVLAYSIPGLDHLLDLIASPAAVVAGALVSLSVIVDLPPVMKVALAIIAGGGMAGLVQGATASLRASSLLATGGLGNILVAILELVGASVTAALAILIPVFVIAALGLCGIFFLLRWVVHRRSEKRTTA